MDDIEYLLLLLLAAMRRAAPMTGAGRQWLRLGLAALRDARWITRERLMRWGIGVRRKRGMHRLHF